MLLNCFSNEQRGRSDLWDGWKCIMSFIFFTSFSIVSAELHSMKFLGREALGLMDIYRIE